MKNWWKSPRAGGALIIALTVVAYSSAMRGGFVFDDRMLITDNPMIKASDGLHRFWLTTEAPYGYPLTWSLWWLEWRLWGATPAGYHVVNVLLHAANAILVWRLLLRLKVPGAWLVGLVFAIHPVNVATVAWISELKNTLSMLFYALAILLYLRFDEEDRWRWYGLSLAAFALAVLSKAAVVMLPVVLLGCAWWRHGRLQGKEILRSVPFFVLSLISGLATIWFEYRALGEHVVRTGSLVSRLASAGWRPWFYLYKALLPFDLMVIYPHWDVDASRWVSYVPGMILMGSVALFWWKRKSWGRPCLFGLGYYVVMLFPVLGFYDQAFYRLSPVADHWQYYSIPGAIALVVAAGVRLYHQMDRRGEYLGIVAVIAVSTALGAATWRRGWVYSNNETLWRDNVTRNPNAWLAHNNLGVELKNSGRVPEAIAHYQQALQIKPDFAEAHYNLGNILLDFGRAQEAIRQYEEALRSNPVYPEAHYNLGVALEQMGRTREAIVHYQQVLQIKPDYAEAHYNLGNILSSLGKTSEAIEHYEQALRANPDYPAAHCNLGNALLQAGDPVNAIRHYQEALRSNPEYVDAHNNLASVLLQLGKLDEAIGHWEQAVRIRPDFVEAHYNLGMAWEQAGKPQEAIREYEQALRIKPGYAEARNKLARLRTVQ